jgi:hypothetical protein
LLFLGTLRDSRGVTKVFCQSRDGQSFARFKLDAIDPTQDTRALSMICERCDLVQPNRWLSTAFASDSDFDAVLEAGDRDVQMRVSFGQMLESFFASRDYGLLQLDGSVIRQSGGVG